MKIGRQLTEKSTKNMRSWLITFNVTVGIFMLSRMAHSTYLYCLIDVIHNDFKLADQKTSFSYGHEFMNVVIFNNAPRG